MSLVSHAERLRLLAGSSLFRQFPPAELAPLAERMVERRYADGQMIFARGEPGTCLFAVARGRVRLSLTSAQGREALIGILNPGEVFGELALLDGGTRSADAIAADGCLLLSLDRRDFLRLLDGVPEARWHLFHLLCERLRSTTERLERTLFLSVAGRLAGLLLTLSDQEGRGRVGRMTQSDLGRLIGASREKVNVEINAWLAEGVLRKDGRSLVIRDRGRLRALAECEA
jgi:CRP-like cAMP-binding protein